jgi:uncharacterized membrane-anchored protein
MSTKTLIALSAVAFAVLWTAAMLWWTAPHTTASVISLVVAGLVAGLAWYWLYGKWYRWYFDPKH